MQAYIAKRVLQTIPLLIFVTFLSYSLILLLPGGPVTALLTGGEALDPQALAAKRHELGLDKPIPVQYVIWLDHALRGNLGTSTQTQRPVLGELRARLPVTLQLGLSALLLGVLVAIPAGVVSAIWRNSLADRVVTLLSIAGVAIPEFWFAIMLILLFSMKLGWLQPVGFVSITTNPVQSVRHLIMPGLALGWGVAALLARQTRSSMLEVLQQDYVRTARSKGLHEVRVITVHALKNALLPVITVLGLLVGRVVAGAVIIEQIFAIPGMGSLLVASVFARDFPMVQGEVLVIAIAVVGANLVTDLVYAMLDPRIRYA